MDTTKEFNIASEDEIKMIFKTIDNIIAFGWEPIQKLMTSHGKKEKIISKDTIKRYAKKFNLPVSYTPHGVPYMYIKKYLAWCYIGGLKQNEKKNKRDEKK